MASSGKEDEEFARWQQAHLHADYLSDSDDDTATVLRSSQFDSDEAFAQQLQAEEYSGTSPTAPSHPYFSSKQHSIHGDFMNRIVDDDEPPAMSDAELAAHLQAEEQHQQRRAARRQSPSGTRAFPLQTTNAARRRPSNHQPSSTEAPHPVVNILANLLQSLAFPNNSARGNHVLRGHAVNLQNNQADFGPDDYEVSQHRFAPFSIKRSFFLV